MSDEIKSTLVFTKEEDVKAELGEAGKGHVIKRIVDRQITPTEQIETIINEYEQGVREPLHWHITEQAYYILSGRAVMKDIKGKTYNLGPETLVYAPAGIGGAHSFEAKTKLKLLTLDTWADIQGQGMPWIIVDEKTKESTIELENILKFGKTSFKPK